MNVSYVSIKNYTYKKLSEPVRTLAGSHSHIKQRKKQNKKISNFISTDGGWGVLPYDVMKPYLRWCVVKRVSF